jgi:prevent-host-death family protein
MDIEEIGAFEAKTRFAELLEQVARGRVYRITKRGSPVAELRPVPTARTRPTFGADRGRVVMSDDFDEPLDDMKPSSIRSVRSRARGPGARSRSVARS